MFNIDKKDAYRLVDILDHDRKSKVDERALYQDRIGCVAKNLRKRENFTKNAYCLQMDFVQDAEGNFINRHLQTSTVNDIVLTEDTIEIHTKNSIYVLKLEEVMEPEPLDEEHLIELYLSDDYEHFCKGYYYDSERQPHALTAQVHVGTLVDSCLLYPADDQTDDVCRFFLHEHSIEFYKALYGYPKYKERMLLHNCGKTALMVTFQSYDAIWTILPGETKTIVPYCADGADEEE